MNIIYHSLEVLVIAFTIFSADKWWTVFVLWLRMTVMYTDVFSTRIHFDVALVSQVKDL